MIITDEPWHSVRSELDRWSAAGLRARLWLRDDDAVTRTAALDALLARCRSHALPLLVATIPATLERELVTAIGDDPLVTVAVHGIAHLNHAPAERRAEELALERGRADISAALVQATARVRQHFGPNATRWYVPPWNRIAPEVAAWLPEFGFTHISTFGPRRLGLAPALVEANTHLDIIDWKGGRIGRPLPWVATELTRVLERARLEGGRPVGLLTHHLVHDDTAWQALDAVIAATHSHPAVLWVSADEAARFTPDH